MAGDKFMPELHLKQPRFTYNTSGAFIKHHQTIQIYRKTGNLKHFHRNELDSLFCL